MRIDGRGPDADFLRRSLGPHPGCQQGEDFPLPVGEFHEALQLVFLLQVLVGVTGEPPFTGHDGFAGVPDLVEVGRLDQKTTGALPAGQAHQTRVVMRRVDEDPDLGEAGEDPPHRLDAVDVGHLDVEQDQVRMEFPDRRLDLGPVPDLLHHGEPLKVVDALANRLADDPVVITDEDPVIRQLPPMTAGAP